MSTRCIGMKMGNSTTLMGGKWRLRLRWNYVLNARSEIFCIWFGQWLETSKVCQFLKFRFQRIITGTRQESRVQQPLHGEQHGHQGEGQQSCLNGSHCFVHNYFIEQNVDLCYMFMISESNKITTCIFRNIFMCNCHINLLALTPPKKGFSTQIHSTFTWWSGQKLFTSQLMEEIYLRAA